MSLLTQRAGDHYDVWESQPPTERARVIARRLDEYVEFARKYVPFYRSRLETYGKTSGDPLAGVPILESVELRKRIPPLGTDLMSSTDPGFNVFQSGGTTGAPKTTLFSHEELEALNLPNARGFYAMGLGHEDRVCNLFAVGGLYMTFIHINRMLQQYGCTNFPFSNHTAVEFIHTVAKLFKVNCIAGITSVGLNCLRGFERLGLADVHLEKFYTGGEHIYEADARWVKQTFGCSIVGAPGYGTVDTWYIGYQCVECPIGVFHAHDDQTYVEILDEESGLQCTPGQEGIMLATAFLRRLTPVIRYRVGDRAVWLPQPCSCGRTTPLFRLLGRSDDVLRIGFDSVDYAFVQSVVASIEGLSGGVQIEKRRREGKDELIVRVESDRPVARRPDLRQRLAHDLVEQRPSLSQFVKEGTVWPVVVEVMDIGHLPRNARTGKLMRVIDVL